jgi:hypothetical protein
MCQCLEIVLNGNPENTFVATPNGNTAYGQPVYQFTDGLFSTWIIQYDGEAQNWYVWIADENGNITGANIFSLFQAITEVGCPLGNYFFTGSAPEEYPITELFAKSCGEPCECLDITVSTEDNPPETISLTANGTINGYNSYTFSVSFLPFPVVLYYLPTPIFPISVPSWVLAIDGDLESIFAGLPSYSECPEGTIEQWEALGTFTVETTAKECECKKLEDRIFKKYPAVKLPQTAEENRGLKDCCCSFRVFGNTGGESWTNDQTSAWIKGDGASIFTFKLTKNGEATSYQPTVNVLPNDIDTQYITVNWGVVLNSDGAGCYKIEIQYNVAGITGSLIWGVYELEQFTINRARKTARLRAIFNGRHEAENIDFTGSNVVSDLRFYGYIGDRQPNTQITNLIYGNREVKRTINENLNQYTLTTEPTDECVTKPLIDIFLLSGNELFISDYNAHNHSYKYQDTPVILEESPEVEYYEFSRKAKVTVVLSDKFKNQRTRY